MFQHELCPEKPSNVVEQHQFKGKLQAPPGLQVVTRWEWGFGGAPWANLDGLLNDRGHAGVPESCTEPRK